MENSNISKNDNSFLIDHARTMFLNASDVRMRNFNFFLVIVGALVALYSTRIQFAVINPVISVSGFVFSILFYILDVRSKQLLNAAHGELKQHEKNAGINIIGKIHFSTFHLISHTFVYRFIYISVMICSVYLFVSKFFR